MAVARAGELTTENNPRTVDEPFESRGCGRIVAVVSLGGGMHRPVPLWAMVVAQPPGLCLARALRGCRRSSSAVTCFGGWWK